MIQNEKGGHKELVTFLKQLKQIFNVIIDNSELLNESLLKEPIQKLFPEIKITIDKAIGFLDDVRNNILEEVGLTGNHLNLKLMGFYQTYDEWNKNSNKPRNVLKRLFKWLNLILGSLSKVNPMFEKIKEFKEVLECVFLERGHLT